MIRTSRIFITEYNIEQHADLTGPDGITIREQWEHWCGRQGVYPVMIGLFQYDDEYWDPVGREVRPPADSPSDEATGAGQSLEEEFFSRVGTG